MSGARTITTFLVDVSPAMAAQTTIKETVYNAESKQYEEAERTLSFVELGAEVIVQKLKEAIFADLKTNKCAIITFGSPRTNNLTNAEQGAYEGIDMIWPIRSPNLETLELVRRLRAARPEDEPKKADPLDAVVVAISTILNPQHDGLKTSQRDTWTRTIYLITDASQTMDISEVDTIKDSLIQQKIGLKVVGVNFDDNLIGFKQPNKPTPKRHNEEFWHSLLVDVPDSGVASIDYVYLDNLRPEVKIIKSAMKKNTLTLGNPDHALSDDPTEETAKLLRIDVRVGKMISIARPITQSKISRKALADPTVRKLERGLAQARAEVALGPSATPDLPDYSKLGEAMRQAQALGADVEMVDMTARRQAQEGGADPDADDGAAVHIPTYGVTYHKVFFAKGDLVGIGSEKEEKKDAQPISGARRIELPDGTHKLELVDEDEPEFVRGWKLGSALVPITDDLYTDPVTRAGIEIIGFQKRSQLPPYYKMGETYYVMAEEKDLEAQVQISALATAMQQMKRFAIVRWVKADNAAPLLGALMPPVAGEADCFHLVSLPFSNDIRNWSYQPLNRVIDKVGDVIFDHPTLPSARMEELTDQLVDAASLMNVVDEEDGEPYEWGPPDDILNPYIHRLKHDVVNRVLHPDRPLVAPHEELTRHFHPPHSVLEAVEAVREKMELEDFLPRHRGKVQNKKKREREGDEGGSDNDHDHDQEHDNEEEQERGGHARAGTATSAVEVKVENADGDAPGQGPAPSSKSLRVEGSDPASGSGTGTTRGTGTATGTEAGGTVVVLDDDATPPTSDDGISEDEIDG